MFIPTLLYFVNTFLKLYNRICLSLFKLTFFPYCYLIYKGNVIEQTYITYGDTVISKKHMDDELTITYECDKQYNCCNRIISDDKEYIFTDNNIKYTNYVFVNITLSIEGEDIVLFLRTNKYNFYICDNVINSDFIFYFINNIMRLKNKYCLDTPYVVKIIDNRFKEYKITNTDYLILHKNEFKVYSKNNKYLSKK